MGQIIIRATEEVLGQAGFNAILNIASLSGFADLSYSPESEHGVSFQQIGLIQQALESVYGPRGGRGVALRIGRACFRYGLREYGRQLGLTQTAFRLLPFHTKISSGGRIFAEFFNQQTDQRVRFEEKEGFFYWHIDRCPLCWEHHSDEPSCHLAVGLLQESLYWLSSGKIFNVEEISCIACGDPSCTILIDQAPIA
jgi:predicted hydrocarbon binding protein